MYLLNRGMGEQDYNFHVIQFFKCLFLENTQHNVD